MPCGAGCGTRDLSIMLEEALLSIGLVIVVAKLAEGLLRHFRLNSIVAYTTTGILLGPVAGIVKPTSEMQILLGIGIFLFFFLIGLDELDISGFIAAIHGRFFVASIISVLLSLVIALFVTSDVIYDFGLGLTFTGSLALAGVLSLTSLGVVAKVLVDEGRLKEPIGIQIFTTALIAELLTLLLVGFTIGEHVNHLGWESVLVLPVKIAVFTVVTWVLASRVLPPLIVLLKRFLHVPQLSFGLILGGLFLTVVGAEHMGLHGSLGALLFGAALSKLPYHVRRDVVPGMKSTAEGLFVPLFFASAGLHLSLAFTGLPVWTIVALVFIPLVGKFSAAFIAAVVARLDVPFVLATGMMAKGVAEMALLLVLLDIDMIGHGVFSLLVLIMLAYILLTPLAIRAVVNRVKPSAGGTLPESLPPSLARFMLDDITVGDILDRTRTYPDPSMSVRAFVDQWMVPHQQDYVVVDHGELSGIVSLSMLRYLPKEAWSHTPLRKLARPRALETCPDELVEDALQHMIEYSLTVIPVRDRESRKFLGVVTSRQILELITRDATGEY
ncbi:MAG: CBS domain-containing protein [Nitrospira sp. SB0677_bin_15]|nr:CBS domain-containing protein [Nitrospira sp. SB0667_bin_9]MYD32175.1 CBS domain-containing protein [Nitrospira sp. SB0661_bin_20]MYG40017.1 CBS domain-containing protein [Nitrospira sp. SB0677_bin_15]MYJ23281.1 CBS domain-containing protein [Nitrospira sp. SB0673_bin_12]